VEQIKSFLRRWPHVWYWAGYGLAVGFFLWSVGQFYLPGKGFSCLIIFGGKPPMHHIHELQEIDYYVEADEYGYDSQYYAQIAVKPLLESRDLRAAMDNLPYRARRILFCWTAYVLGLGQPNLIVQAYALQNVFSWLLLAWLLLRWFPPTGPGNFLRWAGVMFAWGLAMCVRASLMDGPSLLLIAWGVMLAEQGRRWSSACVLGVAGLGRETNLLAAAIHLPGRDWSWRELLRAVGRGLVVVAPLAVWMMYLWHVFGQPSNAGHRNISAPFEAYFAKWQATVQSVCAHGWASMDTWTLLAMISLTVQFLAIVLRPQWSSLWWRIGAAYAMLMVFLGEAVWEGFPGAAPRIVVPLTLAFNVVVPRGLRWWPVLLLGNLSAIGTLVELKPVGRESFLLEGPRAVWRSPAGRAIDVAFASDWYPVERSRFEYWRWSRGSADLVISNPQTWPVEVALDFDLRANDERTVRVLQRGTLRWEGRVGREGTKVHLPQIELEPEDNHWRFETDRPPTPPNHDQLRPVGFSLRNLVIRAVRKIDRPGPPGATRP
jgi:hypothetical protein